MVCHGSKENCPKYLKIVHDIKQRRGMSKQQFKDDAHERDDVVPLEHVKQMLEGKKIGVDNRDFGGDK
eukprot:14919339-Ditylum_brightwellii.AAC.1